MAIQHDSVVGYWEGTPNLRPPNFGTPGEDADLSYLPGGLRNTIVDFELSQLCKIGGSDGKAKLKINSTRVFTLRRPDRAFFESQLTWLRAYSDLRGDRIAEIHVQMTDILSFFGAAFYLNDGRRKATLELLFTVYRLVYTLEQTVKHLCRSARPMDFSNEVQPIIQTPAHSAFPSGHATEAFVFATVLHRLTHDQSPKEALTPPQVPMAFRIASRIAINRTVAGVHFPVDTFAGAALGCAIGDAVYALANGKTASGGSFKPQTDGTVAPEDDFSIAALHAILADAPTEPGGSAKKPKAPIFAELWKKAAAEWGELNGGA